MLPFSVEWSMTLRELDASLETDILSAETIKKTLSRQDYPGTQEEIAELKRQDTAYDRGLSEQAKSARLKPRLSRHFLWTDGTSFQYRSPAGGEEISLDGPATTSAEFLISNWLPVRIYSFVPNRVPKLRIWLGQASDEKTFHGLVGSSELSQLQGRVRFPPMGAVRLNWADRSRFGVLDKWLAEDATDALQKSEPGEPIQGEETILVRCALGGKSGGSVGRVSLWVAHRKGFLPLRIEHSYSGGPLTLEPAEGFPSRLYQTIEVDGITESKTGYYPRKVKATLFSPDPQWRAVNTGKDPSMVPDVPVKMVAVSTIEEEFVRLESQRKLDGPSMDLRFPVGTRFQDLDTREWYLEGTPKEEFDRQLVAELTTGDKAPLQRPTASTKHSRVGPVLIVNALAIVFLAVIYTIFRRRARQ